MSTFEGSSVCKPSICDAQTQVIVETYLSTPAVIQDLRFWVVNLGVTINAARGDRDRAAKLAQRIQKTLQ